MGTRGRRATARSAGCRQKGVCFYFFGAEKNEQAPALHLRNMRHAATQTRPGVCRIHFHLRHPIVSRRSRCSAAIVSLAVHVIASLADREMPGTDRFDVKCEPLSDDEDINSKYVKTYIGNETSEYYQVKLEQVHNDDNSSNLLHHLQGSLEELAPAPAGPAATPVSAPLPAPSRASLATLEPATHHEGSSLIDRHIQMMRGNEIADSLDFVPLMAIKDEPSSEGEQPHLSGDDTSDSGGPPLELVRGSPKTWTQQDMDKALEALREHNMSLTKASATYGIPSTTLWQRAHRLGIDTPKKEGTSKSWNEADLRGALHALRAGAISANKASKAYGIPSSTLYKIARREGIRLSAPFNAAPTAWRRDDLARALTAIRAGAASVQRAAATYGIPTGTLYGRCKREGIELSRSNPTPWSEDAMGEALEAVRVGQMSINQAAIHYNLPYSSLYGRFKRCKYQPLQTPPPQELPKYESENQKQDIYYQHAPTHTDLRDPYAHNISDIDTYTHMYYSHCNVTS